MPILFAVVSRGSTVLAKHAACAGNFMEVVEQVLSKITEDTTRASYTHNNYLFHYLADGRIIYLCITDDDFDRTKAFLFLGDIKRRFETQYGERRHTALPYSMNSDFSPVLVTRMRFYSTDTASGSENKVKKVTNEVEELKGIMVKNIDSITERGERLELLLDKAEDLDNNAISFKRSSRNLARSMWWKNIKLTIIIVVILIVLTYIIVTIACGGFDWNKCIHKS